MVNNGKSGPANRYCFLTRQTEALAAEIHVWSDRVWLKIEKPILNSYKNICLNFQKESKLSPYSNPTPPTPLPIAIK